MVTRKQHFILQKNFLLLVDLEREWARARERQVKMDTSALFSALSSLFMGKEDGAAVPCFFSTSPALNDLFQTNQCKTLAHQEIIEYLKNVRSHQ